MATSEILLWPGDREDPASNAPGASTITSAAAATTNAFQTEVPVLDFDQTTDECTSFPFYVPANYSSGGTVIVQWCCTGATSGNVVWKASIYVATASSSDIDTSAAFNTVDVFTAEAVPGTAGHFKTSSKALTSPGLAAARYAIVMLGRDADHASDTAAADARLLSVAFQFTST